MEKGNKIRINLVRLGYLKHNIDFKKIRNWKSKLFVIKNEPDDREHLGNADDYFYSDDELLPILNARGECDVTIGVINRPIEDNFYLRRLSGNKCIISLYRIDDVLRENNLELEKFIIRNIYEVVAFLNIGLGKFPSLTIAEIYTHEDTRCCLFDMNIDKTDVVFSIEKLILCPECEGRLRANQLPSNFISQLKNEIKKIKKRRYYRITDWIKAHPVWSIVMSTLFAVVIGVISNWLYALLFSTGVKK